MPTLIKKNFFRFTIIIVLNSQLLFYIKKYVGMYDLIVNDIRNKMCIDYY